MDLDKIFEAFVNPQTVTVCLAVYLMTFVVRKVIEGVWQKSKDSRLWREVWLPIGPIANGAFVGAVAKTFVWPAIVGTSLSGRIMYGAICGVFSGFLYNRIRSWLQSSPAKVGGKVVPVATGGGDGLPPAASDPPPADDTTAPATVTVTTTATATAPAAATATAPADPKAPPVPPPTGRS